MRSGFVFLLFILLSEFALSSDCRSYLAASDFSQSLVSDLVLREALPETHFSKTNWLSKWGSWGPPAASYPKPQIPVRFDSLDWKRARVEVVAHRYLGLPYRHRHIPSLGGLDCSNFTAWVYNFGLGIHFPSNIELQSLAVGRQLAVSEPLAKGDLLFLWNKDRTRINHVVIYLNKDQVIDAAKGRGVQIRKLSRIQSRMAWARRVIDSSD